MAEMGLCALTNLLRPERNLEDASIRTTETKTHVSVVDMEII